MPFPTPNRSSNLLRISAPAALLLIAAALLLRFPPTQYSFYPQCPVYHYLGLLCPGCGTTRALAALLHGHITEALHLNALTTLSLPLAALWLATRRSPRWTQPPPAAIYTALAVTAIFTVARNLPAAWHPIVSLF